MTDTKSPDEIENSSTDTSLETAASTQAGAEASATPGKKGRRKMEALTSAPTDKPYVTVVEHSMPFDIQIRNEIIQGQWARTDKHVEFIVPADLVEGFEKHYHFVSGNIVAAD